MASINYRQEFEVNAAGGGTLDDTCPPEFLGGAGGTISLRLADWGPGTYLVMISKAGKPSAGGGDQNKEGAPSGSGARG